MRRNFEAVVITSLLVFAACMSAGAEQHLKKHIKGSLKNDVYISQVKDFQVRVPVHEELGGAVRDEYGERDGIQIEQVIFTDDFGGFYRIVSLKTAPSMEEVMNVLHDVRDKKEIQSARGREFRAIDVEKEGAEMSITTIQPGVGATTVRPDMVTANAIFEANGRIYHLAAGVMVSPHGKAEDKFSLAQQRLEELLKLFETVENKKPANQ